MELSTRDGTLPSRTNSGAVCDLCLSFENQQARVRVCVNSPLALELVERILPVGSRIVRSHSPDVSFSLSIATGVGTGDAPHCLYRGTRLLQSSPDLEPLLQGVASRLRYAVAKHARSSVFVHAGVVGWQDRAILLPGPSMSGKSSLVAALLRAGAEYYSDEYAIIGARGLVHPCAKPLGLRAPGEKSRPFTPEALGARVGTRPLAVSLIVSTSYSPGTPFEPRARGPSHGLMILVANTVVIRQRPRFALDRLATVAGAATTLEGVRGDADEAAAWLLRSSHTQAVRPTMPEYRR
jgi:hypothetical protein